MKLLRINRNRGSFVDDKDEFTSIDKITKEDLLRLVNLTLEEEKVEFDEYDEDKLQHPAHQIIYKSIFEKLSRLRDRRQEFKDESERMYLEDYEKYRDESSQQGV